MLGIKEYIERNINGTPSYNMPQWQCSFVLGGASLCNYEAPQGDNIHFIIINLISVSIGNQTTGAWLYFDNTNTKLIEIKTQTPQCYIAPFNFLVKGNAFKFRFNDDGVNFALNFTTVTLMKK